MIDIRNVMLENEPLPSKEVVEKTMEALERNKMNSFYVDTKEQALNKVLELIPENSTVGFGGSVSLKEIGLLDALRKGSYKLIDRYDKSRTKQEILEMQKECFKADFFITGANAITQYGDIYYKDGRGSRVAFVIFGPKKVVLVISTNKIVKNIDEAEHRLQKIAAPLDNVILKTGNPCTKTGHCVDCNSDNRICCSTLILHKQREAGRINIVFVNEKIGF